MIENLAAEHPIRTLCTVLEVPRSGYYQWRRKGPSPRAQANQ